MENWIQKTGTAGAAACYAPQLLGHPGVRHVYTTRQGGVSQGVFASLNFRHTGDGPENIRENCSRAAAWVGRRYEDIVRTRQEHTDRIDVVAGSGRRASASVLTARAPATAWSPTCRASA